MRDAITGGFAAHFREPHIETLAIQVSELLRATGDRT